MLKLIENILTLPFRAFVHLLGYGTFICFYLQIVLTPTFILGLASTLSLNYSPYEDALTVIYGFSGLGVFIGLWWAENIRKKYTIFGFHGYLLNHPDIDGRQQPDKGIVFRNGNLKSHSSGTN